MRDARPTGRQQRRSQLHDLSRSQLLDAAEEVFGRKGFHQTTLKEVAEAAEFSVGSVYSFFENKDDLFRQIFVRRGEEHLPAMQAVAEADGSALDQLHRLVDLQIAFFRRHPHFGRLYLRYCSADTLSADPRVGDLVASRHDAAMAVGTRVFARGQAQGELCAGDPELLARMSSGMVTAFQSLDPAVMADGGRRRGLPVDTLHAALDGAFAATGPTAPPR